MAGYFLYSLDAKIFTRLTTVPTRKHSLVLADAALGWLDDCLDDIEDKAQAAKWPRDRDALAESIRVRLASPDWYSDLSYESARVWDNVLDALEDEAGEAIGVDFLCENDGYLDWDAAETAAEHGARMMGEPHFGGGGFRYFGESVGEYKFRPMYSLYTADRTQVLLAQLEGVVAHFLTLPEGEGTERDQFFKGLLDPVREVVARGRVLWVQTDT